MSMATIMFVLSAQGAGGSVVLLEAMKKELLLKVLPIVSVWVKEKKQEEEKQNKREKEERVRQELARLEELTEENDGNYLLAILLL